MSAESGKPQLLRATWQKLLIDHPPYRWCLVECQRRASGNKIAMPEVVAHCEQCDGLMRFECTEEPWAGHQQQPPTVQWTKYRCKHCEQVTRVFGLVLHVESAGPDKGWHILKLGEYPPYGPQTPARLIGLLGPEREQFLKGRRAESQGFGIGAFGYYRRVVESQRDRLLRAIISAAERTNATPETVAQLKRAQEETRFTESMNLAQEALPNSLFINGHNPLRLLHSALSEGLHELPDERCLQLATAVREVLAALAERLAEVTRDQANLNAALSTLNSPRAES